MKNADVKAEQILVATGRLPATSGMGLTEEKAAEAGYKYKVTKLPLDQVPIALASRDTRDFIKLIADTASNTIIGAHIVAPEAGNMIQTAVMAIQFGLKPDDISKTFFPYLTDVEGVKLAVLSFNREISRLSCCAV